MVGILGSSPRMWGIREHKCDPGRHPRFIPTHVGHTLSYGRGGSPAPVHPHACGAYDEKNLWKFAQFGSSPRMWGIRSPRSRREIRQRFIPTHVGHTLRSLMPCFSSSVHPHACGAYYAYIPDFARYYGSSPRMWGIPLTIPNMTEINAVHPHACGAYAMRYACFRWTIGSSPRMWGIRCCPRKTESFHRFIPTHVGHTSM